MDRPSANKTFREKNTAKIIHTKVTSVFFFPVNLKSARERQFFLNVHGYFFAFTGTFFGKFTGKLMRSRAVFGIYSRAVFMVHGHDFLKMFTGTR